MSNEAKILQEAFVRDTGLTTLGTIEERHLPHWVRLGIAGMNYDTMQKVCFFIRKNFTVKDKYTHLMPTVHSYKDNLVLTVDRELIKIHLIK